MAVRSFQPHLSSPSPLDQPPPLLRVLDRLNNAARVLQHLLNLTAPLHELVLDLLAQRLALQAALVQQHTRDLRRAHARQQEVDAGEEEVARLDDEAPARPDRARGRQGGVLRERELRGGAREVGGASEDETPL